MHLLLLLVGLFLRHVSLLILLNVVPWIVFRKEKVLSLVVGCARLNPLPLDLKVQRRTRHRGWTRISLYGFARLSLVEPAHLEGGEACAHWF